MNFNALFAEFYQIMDHFFIIFPLLAAWVAISNELIFTVIGKIVPEFWRNIRSDQ